MKRILCLLFIVFSHQQQPLLCPLGRYYNTALDRCELCKRGFYGAVVGLIEEECSGPCQGGYFCPQGSTRVRERECGGPQYYCPVQSHEPTRVHEGYYTTITSTSVAQGVDSAASLAMRTQASQWICEPGHFCIHGIRRVCPAGVYGKLPGLMTEACSGICPVGSFCPEGSESPTPCPAGRFGNATGLVSKSCSYLCSIETECIESECPPGFYCPVGTKTPIFCGAVDVYCPSKSPEPVLASPGYYTVSAASADPTDYLENGLMLGEDYIRIRIRQVECEIGHYCTQGRRYPCPAGTYGSETKLSSSTCTAICPKGYYCPKGTSSYQQLPCGRSAVYCPGGSEEPQIVAKGYYSNGGTSVTREEQVRCEVGHYCVDGIKHFCPAGTYGGTGGLSTSACSGKCDDGHICGVGSVVPNLTPCLPGYYSTNGKRCSVCSAGYWCEAGSISPMQHECGGDDMYCPLGSAGPLLVNDGFYSVGGSAMTRSSQASCLLKSCAFLPQCPTSTQGNGYNL